MLLLTSSHCMTRCTERVTPVPPRVSDVPVLSSCTSTACSPQGLTSRHIATNLPPFDPLQQQHRAWHVLYPQAVRRSIYTVS